MSEITPELQVEINEYEMPDVHLGDNVIFYEHCERKRSTTSIGTVAKNNGRNLTVRVGNRVYDSVRHVSDPRLKTGGEVLQFGSWDFTDAHRGVEELRQRVEAVEAMLEELTCPKTSKAKTAKAE